MKRQIRHRDEGYKKLTGKYSDDSDEETELFIKKTYQEPPSVEKVVDEGDTLQSIAIQYRCTVEELKRLNHILNDNEIYAKGIIKVPDRPISNIIAGIHHSGNNSPKRERSNQELEINKLIDIDRDDNNHTLLDLPINVESTVNNVIFNTKIIRKNKSNGEDEIEGTTEKNTEEEVTLLPKEATIKEPTPWVSCSGADGDISWVALVICIVTLIVVLPLIFVFYIYEHPHNGNNNNSHYYHH